MRCCLRVLCFLSNPSLPPSLPAAQREGTYALSQAAECTDSPGLPQASAGRGQTQNVH